MAQETRVAPIQLNDDASKILMDLGDSFAKMKMQKAQMDNERAKAYGATRQAQQKNIEDYDKWATGQVTSLKADPNDIKMAMDLVHQYTTSALKGNISDNIMRDNINQVLSKITLSANNRNVVDQQAQDAIKNNPDLDPNALNANLAKNVLTQDATKINVGNVNYAQEALTSKDAWQLYDPTKAQATTLKVIGQNKDKQVYSTEVGGQVGLTRTIKGDKVSFDPTFYELDGKGGVRMMTDGSGLLAEKAYKELTANASVNAYLSQRAAAFVQHWNDPNLSMDQRKKWMESQGITETEIAIKSPDGSSIIDPRNPETFEAIKKAFATDAVERHSPISINGKDVTTIVTNNVTANPNQYVAPTNPEFTAPVDRLRAITKLDERFLGEKKKSGTGKDVYDVTAQFKSLPLYKNMATDKVYGPAEVQFVPAIGNTPDRILIREKPGKPLKPYTINQFMDLLEPKTGGTGYDPKDKPQKGNPR